MVLRSVDLKMFVCDDGRTDGLTKEEDEGGE